MNNLIVTERQLKSAERRGISKRAFFTRLSKGWDVKKALSEPAITREIEERAKAIGITPRTVYNRLKRGLTLDEALSSKTLKRKSKHDWDKEIYAMYKGEELLADGTVYEIAEQLFISVDSVKTYYGEAVKKRNKSGNRMELIYLGVDEDE